MVCYSRSSFGCSAKIVIDDANNRKQDRVRSMQEQERILVPTFGKGGLQSEGKSKNKKIAKQTATRMMLEMLEKQSDAQVGTSSHHGNDDEKSPQAQTTDPQTECNCINQQKYL